MLSALLFAAVVCVCVFVCAFAERVPRRYLAAFVCRRCWVLLMPFFSASASVVVLVLMRAQGWQRWTDGRTFEGQWKDGKPHGKVSGTGVL